MRKTLLLKLGRMPLVYRGFALEKLPKKRVASFAKLKLETEVELERSKDKFYSERKKIIKCASEREWVSRKLRSRLVEVNRRF